MATVYVGRLRGAKGFWRLVAIKRAHAFLVGDEKFRKSLVAEARVASQVHHQNVVSIVDVEEPSEELLLIMDYVEGASLSQLITAALKKEKHLPVDVVVRIILDAAAGLHAAHELADENGEPLAIVHRDVSPQNILVGTDGAARIADFGIAKCADSGQATVTGLQGKVGYMAPEYIQNRRIDRRVDVFALGVVAWESLTGLRLFRNDHEPATITAVLEQTPRLASEAASWVPPELDASIARALAKDPSARYPDALAFARDLEAAAKAVGIDPTASAVTQAVRELFGTELDERREALRGLLSKSATSASTAPPPLAAPGAPEATRTRTAHFRGSVSDARTTVFARAPEVQAGEVTQDFTSLVNAGELSPASAKSRRRWMVPVGIGIAAGLALGTLAVRTSRGPSAARPSTSFETGSSPASREAPMAEASPTGAATAAAAVATSVESAAASASPTDKPKAADKPKTADKPIQRRPKTQAPGSAGSEPKKQPGHPGLGY